MTKPIKVSSEEFARLMRESEGRVLAGCFGPNLLAVKPEESPWAVPMLAEWRGITFNEGAGI